MLASRFASRLGDRYQFVFVCLDDIGELGKRLMDAGVHVQQLGRRQGLDWRCAHALARVLRRHRVQVVHAHQYTPFFYAAASRLSGHRIPVLFTEHGRFHPDLPSRKRMVFNRMFLRRRDRVVAVGRAVRRALVDNEGINGDRIDVIYNGIDLAPYAQPLPADERRALRRSLGIREDDVLLVQVARLDYLKDHHTAVRAMAHLVSRHPSVQLLLIGDGPERADIERAIAAHKLENHVRILGIRHDVPRLLWGADVCLLTSISEGIPLTLIEGMAACLPIVATDVGGVREVVEPGSTGLLAPAGDAEALAEALYRLASDTRLRRQMGRRGAVRARRVFAEAHMYDAYGQLYRQMLNPQMQVDSRLATESSTA